MTERRAHPSPVHYCAPPAGLENLHTLNAKYVTDPELLTIKVNAVKVWVYVQDGIKLVSYIKKEVKSG